MLCSQLNDKILRWWLNRCCIYHYDRKSIFDEADATANPIINSIMPPYRDFSQSGAGIVFRERVILQTC
jgi:hypothetical protein